jgi:hypothetical protein
MTANGDTLVALALLLAGELALLWRGQRRLFWAAAGATRSRVLAYALAAPGTALHEASHYLACRALGVPVSKRVRLFWPQRTGEGEVVLGSVRHARTSPLRQALISIAPLLLVPAFLTLATALLVAPDALSRLPDALTGVPAWRAILWVYLSLSCGQAVFPSPGDRIGVMGGILLLVVGLLALGTVEALGGSGGVADVLGAADGILALPALAAAASLVALGMLQRASGPRY